MKQPSAFERYPRLTLLILLLILGIGSFWVIEMGAQYFGLGKAVIYQSHPIYGYRPKPNQIIARKPSQTVHLNNLALRAAHDWDPAQFHNKILFLGDSVTYGGSYITNNQLFSAQATANLPGYEAGNAGVNGWGVDNVHALVKEAAFLPAAIFVTTFPEGDFYRGLARIGGQPFWTHQPRLALEELWFFLLYKMQLYQTSATQKFNDHEKNQIIESSVKKLKALDEYLTTQHRKHIIYISPSRTQLVNGAPIDQHIFDLLRKHNVKVIYLKDKIPPSLTADERLALYHDEIHLSPQGHRLWGQLMHDDLRNITNENS
jgi:lysophospholipase L1-like esterase